MAIHSFFYGWKGDALLSILDKKSSDENHHKEAIKIMQADESIDYAKEKARLIMRRAWESIEPKLKSGDAKDDIHDLSRFLMDRKL
jgi:geranylgeranyl pyrophosphate synthase